MMQPDSIKNACGVKKNGKTFNMFRNRLNNRMTVKFSKRVLNQTKFGVHSAEVNLLVLPILNVQIA